MHFASLFPTDMTFTHEGNRTLLDSAGLVNFEKMHMLAQTMRTLRYCRSRQLRKYLFRVCKAGNVRALVDCIRRQNPSVPLITFRGQSSHLAFHNGASHRHAIHLFGPELVPSAGPHKP